MTDLLLSRTAPAPRPVRIGSRTTVADLARVHAIRMVRHPVFWLGMAWHVFGMGLGRPETAYEQYSAVTSLVLFLTGPTAFFSANLVASSGRRSRTDEWTPSLPMPPAHRTVALLLACLAPAAAVAALDLGLLLVLSFDGLVMPIAWQHVAAVPVAVFGAAVLGVAVARLLPWTGGALVVMAAVIAFNTWTNSGHDYLGLYVDFANWTDKDAIPALHEGSPSWHLVYLVALCGLAASGAFLRDARRPWLPLASGAAFGALVLVAGTLQLT